MKLSTVKDKLSGLANNGIRPLMQKIADNPELTESVEDLEVIVECFIEARRRIERVEAAIDKAGAPKSYNRLSLRIWKRDDYTCVVCGMRDTSCEKLSRAVLINPPTSDGDYTTLCKEHMEAFKKAIPWKHRTNMKNVIDALSLLENERALVTAEVP